MLEVSERNVAAGTLDLGEGVDEDRVFDIPAVDAHALVVPEQVRGRIQTDAVTCRQQYSFK